MALELLGALGYLHDRGYLHRDVKPGNIMFEGSGAAVLMDFGFVRPGKGSNLTRAGVVLGTPRYIPPEMLLGQKLDQTSDLYQLGLVLYEAAAGRPAYGDAAMPGLADDPDRIPRPVSPGDLNGRVRAPLGEFLLAAVEWRREKRYPDADAMAAALRKALSEEPAGAAGVAGKAGRVARPSGQNAIAGRYDLVGEGTPDPGQAYYEARDGSGHAVLLRPLPQLSTTLEEVMRALGPLAGLDHPAIGHIRDLVAHKGQPYLVYDRPVRHAFLQAPEPARPMARSVAARILLGTLAALDQFHSRGLVHGDVMLQNITSDGGGAVRLLGHGYSAIRQAGLFEATAVAEATARIDTWMAPELHSGGAPTMASDVYAVGRLLTLLILGRLPPAGTLRLPATEPFAGVVNKATAPEPADRYPDAAQFAAALGRMVPTERQAVLGQLRRAGNTLRRSAAMAVQKVQQQTPWFLIASIVVSTLLVAIAWQLRR
jgi:serine/threonine protein kinase